VADFASAPTPGGSRGVVTSPQQTASTLVTGINQVEPVPATIASQAATMPTVVSQPSAAAAVPAVPPVVAPPPIRQAAPAVASPAPAKGKGSALIFAGVGIVVLLLIAGVGGYFVMHTMMNKTETTTAQNDGASSAAAGDVAGAHEIGRYWLQVGSDNGLNSVRADENVQMASGQQFKFHFSPSESGYLYIIGPGDANAPTTFLTARPATEFGVRSNEVKSGQDFVFPADTAKKENWMNLDQTAGTDEFTIIFSGTPLTTPAFLEEDALRELSDAERSELDQAIARFKSNLAGTEVMKNAPAPFVSVKVPQAAAEGAPVVFKIKIAHK
jgi:Domain of unknown function (DUF4384)